MDKVDLLYLAWERPEFTEASLLALAENTNFDLVNEIWVYTDGGSTAKWIHGSRVETAKFGSPVAIMNDFLDRSTTPLFVKLDNDTMVPPEWLEEGLRLMEANPKVDCLGIEAHLPPPDVWDSKSFDWPHWPNLHGIKYTRHIGGIGFIQRNIFEHDRPVPRGRYGWTEWQWAHPEILKAWIDPPLRVFLLDHLPFEPWRSLSAEYVKRGWQRESWGEYTGEWSGLWEWWRHGCISQRK